jgi:hypothetical protein
MNSLTALSVSIGVLAGVATFLAVGPLSGIFLIWAATIAWAAYYFLGANEAAVKNTITCGIFGVFMAWVTALQLTDIAPDVFLGFPFWAAVTVAISVVALCYAANIPQLSAIPASVLGYSATFAYLLQTPDKLSKAVLTGISFENPLILISVSIVIGVGFGVASYKWSLKLTKQD